MILAQARALYFTCLQLPLEGESIYCELPDVTRQARASLPALGKHHQCWHTKLVLQWLRMPLKQSKYHLNLSSTTAQFSTNGINVIPATSTAVWKPSEPDLMLFNLLFELRVYLDTALSGIITDYFVTQAKIGHI